MVSRQKRKGNSISPSSSKIESPIERRFSPKEYFRGVRSEFYKLTWPTRREVMIASVTVVFIVCLSTLLFSLVDYGIGALLSYVFLL